MRKSVLCIALAVLAASCSKPAETSEWLFSGPGPYILSHKADTTGAMQFQLVTDISIMEPVQDVIVCQDVTIGPDSLLTVPLGKLKPGFYEVRLGGRPQFTIGVRPEDVASPPDSHPDFQEFWNATLAALDEIPLEVTWEKVPESSNDLRETFRVSYPSLGGALAGGVITIPTAPGKYPVCIQYMGYGADVYMFDPSARPECIDFLVSVRGQGIFKEPVANWIDRGLDSKDAYYYRGAFADAKRAVDFVASLDKADTDRIVAYGESQGGALTVVAAALDHRIKAIAPAVPFLGDYRDYYKIVWWPVHEVTGAADAEGLDRDAVFDMLTYFDVKNFAPLVECPAYMAFGLQDSTCPPHTNFAIYNNLGSAEKHWHCVPTCGHAMWNEPSWPPVRDEFLVSKIK